MPPPAASHNDWIDNYFSYGVDPRRRRVMMHGDVSEESADFAVSGLLLLDSQNDKPIELWISTYGGSVYDMFGLYDVARSLRSPLKTVAHGKIMSAGILLLAAGDSRVCFPNTWFMTHEESWGDEFKGHSHMKNDMAHIDEMEARWAKLMGKRTTLGTAQWKRMSSTGRDRYFDAAQALKWGLVTEIVGE